MTLTEEQIQSNLKAYEHAMRMKSVLDLDYQTRPGPWHHKVDSSFQPDLCYRIRPTPRLRPWKPEEVPQYALIRRKDYYQGEPCEVIMLPEKGYVKDSFSTVYVESGLILYGTWGPESALELAEHSTDGGKTWLPCGVMEDGE